MKVKVCVMEKEAAEGHITRDKVLIILQGEALLVNKIYNLIQAFVEKEKTLELS